MSRADSPLRDKVIFVVGARRSGTNWLQRVIAAHPNVVAVPSETFLFSIGLPQVRERFHQGVLGSTISGFVYAERETILDRLRDLCDAVFMGIIRGLDAGAGHIVERTPNHVLHLDLISEIYPDARVVHIVRDGRDVVRSLLSHDWAPDDVRDATLEWRTAIETARDNAPKLAHYTEVSYERMFTNREREIPALLEALGLPTGSSELAPVWAEAGVSYNADPAAPSIDVGKWRTSLAPDVLATIENVAGDLLVDLGYDLSEHGAAPARQAAPSPQSRPRRRWLRRRRGPTARQRLDQALYRLDLFLDAAAHDPSRIEELIAPTLRVRIVDGDVRYEARGPGAKRRLFDELASDVALRGPQVLGQFHPSTTGVTFVGEFEHEGRRHPRVFVLTMQGDHLIERIAYYRFPTG